MNIITHPKVFFLLFNKTANENFWLLIFSYLSSFHKTKIKNFLRKFSPEWRATTQLKFAAHKTLSSLPVLSLFLTDIKLSEKLLRNATIKQDTNCSPTFSFFLFTTQQYRLNWRYSWGKTRKNLRFMFSFYCCSFS